MSEKPFTVIGYWNNGKRHVIGVIEGEHPVEGGYDPGDEGLFADLTHAESASEAEDAVHGTNDGDDGDWQ